MVQQDVVESVGDADAVAVELPPNPGVAAMQKACESASGWLAGEGQNVALQFTPREMQLLDQSIADIQPALLQPVEAVTQAINNTPARPFYAKITGVGGAVACIEAGDDEYQLDLLRRKESDRPEVELSSSVLSGEEKLRAIADDGEMGPYGGLESGRCILRLWHFTKPKLSYADADANTWARKLNSRLPRQNPVKEVMQINRDGSVQQPAKEVMRINHNGAVDTEFTTFQAHWGTGESADILTVEENFGDGAHEISRFKRLPQDGSVVFVQLGNNESSTGSLA